jgi:streptogramin lyase
MLMVLAALPSLLKSELLPIRTYTTADGLAANRVDSIVPDTRGFLWFCTAEGLSRFDGNRFTTYGVAEGLPHQAINTLIETRSGDHWIGTAKGLSRIATGDKGARFTPYRLGPDAADNDVGTLLETRSGSIRAASRGGLFEWTDPSNFRPNFRRTESRGLEKLAIAAMLEAEDGELWVGTTAGLYLLGDHGIVGSFTIQNGLPGNWVEMLLTDSQGRLWVASRGGLVRMSRGGPGKWRIEKVYTEKSGLAGSDVKAITEASDGTLWVGTSQGISRLRLNSADPAVFQNLTRTQGLSDRWITALAEDQAGNMWAGTEGAGVMRIDALGFTTYREQDGLPSDRVLAVFEDRAGELTALTWAARMPYHIIDIFDGMRFHRVVPDVNAQHPNWGWNQVLLQSRSGEWWTATKHGLCRYPAMKTAGLNGRRPQVCYCPDDGVFRVFEDSRGGIWASAQSPRGDQLIRWDPQSNTVSSFPAPRVLNEPANDLVSAFAEDRQGNIWMGLFKGGLYRYCNGRFQYFKPSDGVPGGTVFALFVDEDGLWIGSNSGGLGRMGNPGDEHPRIEVYDTSRGMVSNMVLCITNDGQGRIYAGTSKGVDRLDPKNGHIRHFSTANGLAHGVPQAAIRDRSGALWFATTQGLSRLSPGAERPPAKPRTLITELRIGGTSFPVSQLGETRVSQLELQPSQNQLQVEFAGPDYEPGDNFLIPIL